MVNSRPGGGRSRGTKSGQPKGGRGARVRLQLDERRAQLLALGRTLFNTRAYDEIAIDDIAAAAGVSKGLLYHYFPSKRRFYVEAVRAAADEMLTLMAPPTDPALAPIERLRIGLDAYLDYVEENARAYAALFRSGLGIDREVLSIVERTRATCVERIVQGLGVAEAPELVRIALRGWIGMVEAASLDWLEHRRRVPRASLRDMFAETLQMLLPWAFAATDARGNLPRGR
jgi:AcrR family transcriptional regulator